jgi:hypothetical protein
MNKYIKVIKIRRVRWDRRVACMGKAINAYNVLTGKLEGKMTL